jgi:alanine-synthesizing transaminase
LFASLWTLAAKFLRPYFTPMFSDRTNWNLETNRLSEALAKHRASRKRLFDLTVSNPTECGVRYDTAAIRKALSQSKALHYEPNPRGLIAARRAIATYHSAFGKKVPPEDILLTTGTSEAYAFVFRLLCNAGDEILVPEPSYPLLNFLADIQDVKLVRYPLVYDHGWQIDFHALGEAITPRSRAIVVINPNNPTGHFTKPAEIKQLNEICASRQMALIADEVFLDFALAKKRPSSFASNEGALTFTMSGLSKVCGLPQMKASWLITSGPEALKAEALARLEVIADTYLSMNTPVQLAIPILLKQRHLFQKQVMMRVRKNLKELDRLLATQKSCGRLTVEGGWNAVLRVPVVHSDEDTAIQLLNEKSVYVHPGHFYDFASDGFLVVSLITPEKEFAEGIKRVLSAF